MRTPNTHSQVRGISKGQALWSCHRCLMAEAGPVDGQQETQLTMQIPLSTA